MLPKAAQTFHGQRGRSQFACRVVTGEVGLTNPHPTRIAVREHDDEPDVAVPTVRLLGSNGLSDQGVASARQSNLGRERCLNVLQSVVHSKLGLPLRHLPSGYEAVNALWMWAALIGLNISSWLQALTGYDTSAGRAHGKRLRRELVCVPARVTHHGGRTEVHCAPEDHDGAFGAAWAALDALLIAAGP